MAALLEPRRALLALAVSACACATYGPELLDAGGTGQGASGGSTGAVAGGGEAAVGAVGAMAGDTSSGSGGTSPEAGGGTGGKAVETAPYVTVIIDQGTLGVGLTNDGTLDWAHWGLKGVNDYNHKAGVPSELLDFKPTGSKAATRYLAGPTSFTWSDGTPTKAATTNDGVMWTGKGEGFQLVVPAVVEIRKLTLYLGVKFGTGQIKATLSDPRANSLVNDRFTSPDASWKLQIVTLIYGNADKADTTLDVAWSVETADDTTAAVCLTGLTIGKSN